MILAYKEATSNLASHHLYTLVPQLLGYELAECLSNSQLVCYFTKHMPNELLPIDPIDRFLTLKQAALCNKRFLPSLNIQIRHFPLQLPPFVWTFCEESSQELEEDVSTLARGISNFGGLCLRGVENLGGLPGKLLSKDNFSPFDSWGVSPSSLLESLSLLTQHKSWAGLWSKSDSFKTCSLMVRSSDKKKFRLWRVPKDYITGNYCKCTCNVNLIRRFLPI